MIKRCISIILVVAMVMAVSPSVFSDTKHLPAIELKGLKLRGTAISGIFKPIAIVEDTNIKKNYWYRVGDTLCGGRIVEILRGAIVLDMDGKQFLFGLPKGSIEGASPPMSEEETIGLGKKVGENIWRVELDTAIDMLTKVNRLMKEARIRPYFAIGKAAGIRIDRIREDSIIKEMGLNDGDIIKGVNGFGLLSPTRIFEAYRRYKSEHLIQVQLVRDGEPVTLTYSIMR